jgi:hypothetical protein
MSMERIRYWVWKHVTLPSLADDVCGISFAAIMMSYKRRQTSSSRSANTPRHRVLDKSTIWPFGAYLLGFSTLNNSKLYTRCHHRKR